MSNTLPQGYERIAGSERAPLPNSKLIGPVDPNESFQVTVYVRRPSSSNIAEIINEQVQHKRGHLSREEYKANHSASPADIAKVVNFARKNDLSIVSTDPAARKVVLAGTAAAMSAAFMVELQCYEHPNGTYRGRTGHIHIPSDLDQVVTGVFGLDNRPQAQPHMKMLDNAANANAVSYTPVQVAQVYDFPTGSSDSGSGECIALIELGGGYNSSDLTTYFQKLNIPMPTVTSVSVDGGSNQPAGTVNSADGEVDLDIEVAGAVAPAAHIVVYFAPNTDQGFLDAVADAIHDGVNKPSVVSISWGSAEANWTAQAMQAMDAVFQSAATMGVTVCVAAGDNGSSDGVTDGQSHVDFPASSPYALACGGTRLDVSNGVASESVWNDNNGSATGGGISDTFDLPAWQVGMNVPPSANANQRVGRGVPDVTGDADPQTGYVVYVDGQGAVFGGTSAVAPLWAALIALINEQRGSSLGYLNPILYQNYAQLMQANALHDVCNGNNGAYSAAPGWDPCSGLGSPDGTNLRNSLIPAQTAGASLAE